MCEPPCSGPSSYVLIMELDWSVVGRAWDLLIDGTWVTLQLFVWSLILATVLGLVLALMHLSKFRVLR